jgi:hypothetical protein
MHLSGSSFRVLGWVVESCGEKKKQAAVMTERRDNTDICGGTRYFCN